MTFELNWGTIAITAFISISITFYGKLMLAGLKAKKNGGNKTTNDRFDDVHTEIDGLKTGQDQIHSRITDLAESSSKTAGAVETILKFITNKGSQ